MAAEPPGPPPSTDKPWIWTGDPSIGEKGWLCLVTDPADGVTDADFDFETGKPDKVSKD